MKKLPVIPVDVSEESLMKAWEEEEEKLKPKKKKYKPFTLEDAMRQDGWIQ
jgi:hypothetical protein